MNETTGKYRAPALERGLDVVELLSEQDEALSKKEISERLGLSVNELFRMLYVLEERGFIAADEETGKFRLTLRTFELSNRHPPLQRLLSAASTELQDLADQTQQACHIAVHQDNMMVVVAQQDSPYKMGFTIRLSARIDIHGSGSGLAFLAFQTDSQANAILEKSNATAEQKQMALSQLEKIRRQGYFVGASPQISGVTNITYPIFNSTKKVEAVLTMPFLTLNSDSLHHQVVSFEDSRKAVGETAERLISAIGGVHPDAR
ncbi:IclR family transcriptional regulator [Tropicimonas sp. TH_r6]|uniref:IclR family transcriptional regulator n=1 Tax=Tropicimonas sp. TH_r6 TaxID=3082085 RepID=UPI002955A01F|nr:IclR family transcriptional regulator [Tropicimonas sp. TH_r6]MDV7144659.1 IclR family transcriptional regulator [Tropicimonas sp. TH_r6]